MLLPNLKKIQSPLLSFGRCMAQTLPLYKIIFMESKYHILVNGKNALIFDSSEIEKSDILPKTSESFNVIDNNISYNIEVEETDLLQKIYKLKLNGTVYNLKIKDSLDLLIDEMGLAEETNTLINEIHAPMPGLLLEFQVVEGDSVSKGDALCVLEAMKMENTLVATRDGVIKTIYKEKGAPVDKGELLIEFEA